MKCLLKWKEEANTRKISEKKKSFKVKAMKNLNLFPLFYIILIIFSLMQLGLNISINRRENALFHKMQSQLNEITIKIDGTGDQYILGGNYSFCPDSIELNGQAITVNSINCSVINIPDEENVVNRIKMAWNDKLYSLHGMFENLTNLVEVALQFNI